MAIPPDAPVHDDSPLEIAALHREVSALVHRWQQAGVTLHDVAMVLATVGCQALGHALGDIAPPEGPEIIQDTRVLYFAIADFSVILSGPIPSSTRKGNA